MIDDVYRYRRIWFQRNDYSLIDCSNAQTSYERSDPMHGRSEEEEKNYIPPSSALSTGNEDGLTVSLISFLENQLIWDQLIIKPST